MMYPSLHRVMGSSFEVPVWFILGLRSRVHRLVDVVVDRVVDHGAPARRLLPHRRDVRQRLTDQRSLSVSGMPGAMRQVGGKTAPGNGRDVRTCTSSSCSSLLSDAASSVAERSDEFNLRYAFNMLYYWKDGRKEDMWTAETLQQMCEVENVVMGFEDYGKVWTATIDLHLLCPPRLSAAAVCCRLLLLSAAACCRVPLVRPPPAR